MNHVLAGAFTDDLLTRLDGYDTLARTGSPIPEREARDAIQALTGLVRNALAGHSVDPHGHCARCPRSRWRRPRGCRLLRDLTRDLDRHTGTGTSGRHAYRP
ncbi:hypothetical protein CFP71_28135 [Amycolatopsis thailandensis]|uniref:Uncharacterized protein n=1 Tax=Amycolatopsis thailandensis TaxID=589330 RepID=A0A229RUD7_9PSEU|nr:hypothetical protein [Amycolatopsis thailandensis]OXM50303.1 hypothetical protein CFP71_28135 [Amycolatopsis thailandensis]